MKYSDIYPEIEVGAYLENGVPKPPSIHETIF